MRVLSELACVYVIALILQSKRFFFFLCFRGVFQSLVSKHFPSEKQRREKAPGNKRKRK